MSNDLVKRLRDTPNWMREGFQDWKDNVRTYDRAPFEAADRIEELEAKLAKAVEALYVIEGWSNKPAIVVSKVRTTLAELTGGKDAKN